MKNNFGPRAGGGGNIDTDENGSLSGVVATVSVAAALSRANRLGVMVTALPELVLPVERVVILRPRTLEGVLREVELDHGSGEVRAD